jgi:hypothetical protein
VIYCAREIAKLVADAATDPKAFDLHFGKPERVYEGIYMVEKDALKVCVNGRADGVKERPNSFSIEGHSDWRLLTFERIKPEDAGSGVGFVGLVLRFDPDRKEVIVNQTIEGSPAKKAGLRKDDVVLGVGGAPASDLRTTVDAVRRAKPGSELAVRVRTGDKEREVKITVGLLPFTLLAGLE